MATGGDMGEIYQSGDLNKKRENFLSTLPSEFQVYFTHGDRFLVHSADQITTKKIKDYEKIEFIPEVKRKIHIGVYEGIEPMDQYTRACLHAYALSSLYDTDWTKETNPLYASTLGCVITILASYAPYSTMADSGLETSLSRCHLEIDKKSWMTKEEIKLETRELREQLAISMKMDDFDKTPQACTIVALTVLLLIGKNVNENNRIGWFRNRWRGLAKIADVTMDVDRIDPPLLRPCTALYTSSSANQPVRSTLFKIMRTLASISDDQTHIVFDRLINLLKWSEMSHIPMIIENVFDQNAEILMFPELHGPEIAAMTLAIQFLKKYNREDRAYLKLLYDHNELKPLHSANFIYFTAAAHAIAAITKTSMLNINTRFSESVKSFQGRILAYMKKKSAIGSLSAGVSYTHTKPSIISTTLTKMLDEPSIGYDLPEFVDRQPEARE